MSSLKLLFEIGHSAERKAKPSKHGFTHDWELFVKSPNDGNDINQFVEKVVFNLHDSFPKPKRVIKDPPFAVKESGYAGFELTIDIYLRNRDEPKKVTFAYDLDLQPFKSEIKEYIVNNPSDDFKRKCVKGGCIIIGGSSDYKGKDYKSSNTNTSEVKKAKRPEDSKTKSYFTELFGDPIEKSSAKILSNKKDEKLPPPLSQTSSVKEKDKSKHKHIPGVESKDVSSSSRKSGDRNIQSSSQEKPKKDKSRDHERSDKKDKSAKRTQSPNIVSSSNFRQNLPPITSQTATTKLPVDYSKTTQPKQLATSVPDPPQSSSSSSAKKSSKKKNSDKDRDKKESKKSVDSPSSKKSTREEANSKIDSRDKNFKPKTSAAEPKSIHDGKKHDINEIERKHKHKKKEKSKEKEKKEKPAKSQPQLLPPPTVLTKSASKFEKPPLSDNSSDSELDMKPDVDLDFKVQQVEQERHHSRSSKEKLPNSSEKENKKRKRMAEKEERDSSTSPPPTKSNKKEPSPSVFSSKSTNSTKIPENTADAKVSNEYLDELKDLKHKITTLKNNDHLQHVVRLIAATGCYEITKSTFDFDLVQLDKNTVQRLQEFFAN